jgi:tryptophan 2,3-dioxygenase
MSLIKRRTRGKHIVRHITRLDRDNNETLYAFATFLDEPTDYVLNQLIEIALAKDKEFMQWREAHPQSFAPRLAGRRVRSGRTGQHRMSAPHATMRDVAAATEMTA